jgi:hypothetical protein
LTNHYAAATRDEVWSYGVRIESRLAHGMAMRDGDTITARDTPDHVLAARVTERMALLRAFIRELGDARVRLVVEASREDGREQESATITVSIDGVSIVTDAGNIDDDVATLRRLLAMPTTDDQRPTTNVVWSNGSAAVLLHEAIGHASEHGHPPIAWPEWLHVDAPLHLRRATFRDVPLPRMTTLNASQSGAPFDVPADPIEIHLLAGGAYEPLTELVTLNVAVATYRGMRLGPFTMARTRRDIAASLAGAWGGPLRYPGVICSREGQELVVGSYAPVVVTR